MQISRAKSLERHPKGMQTRGYANGEFGSLFIVPDSRSLNGGPIAGDRQLF
jgi:hypothetical protein